MLIWKYITVYRKGGKMSGCKERKVEDLVYLLEPQEAPLYKLVKELQKNKTYQAKVVWVEDDLYPGRWDDVDKSGYDPDSLDDILGLQ